MADDNEVVETWESLTDGRSSDPDVQASNQGGEPAPVVPPPATPSVAVAPASTDKPTDAKDETDPVKPAADAKPAGDEVDPAKVTPPVDKVAGEGKVDAKPDGAAEEEESEADKAEFADLPEKAQAPARRYRKESRQFRTFQTDIGGEEFLEDAKLIVPAFHTQPAEKFDEILISRSPGQRNQLYTHMVYTAIHGADRPTVIKLLTDRYKPELEAALGVTAPAPGEPAKPADAHVEPTTAKDFTAELATLDELLGDQYITAEQTTALNAAKASIVAQAKTAQELADLRKMIEEVKAKDQTVQGTTAEQETEKLGDEFLGEVWTFADTRLNDLGLSAADGDPAEVTTFIEQERKRIRELLPARFEAHENAKRLIGLLETKFEAIPKLTTPAAKDAEKKAAWRFMPPVKVCIDEILGKEVASCLKAIEAMRGGTQIAPKPADQRKEIVGHEPPGNLGGEKQLVTGKGVDALWASLTGDADRDSLNA